MNESAKAERVKPVVHTLAEGAVMIALSAVLSLLSLRLWPDGGSIDLVMIPITVFALRAGPGWGFAAGLIYGLIDCLLSGGVAYGWASILLDYLVAYSMVGFAGFFTKKPALGALVACAARLFVHVISGVVIWGQWMPEEFIGLPMTNIWVYSLLYNGTFMACNAILAVAAVAILAKNTRLLQPQKA